MSSKTYNAAVVFGGSVDGSLRGAVGAVSGGLSKVESSVQQNIRALKSQKKVISSLDFTSLRKSQDHMYKASKRVKDLRAEIAACPKPTKKMEKELAAAEKTAQKATAAFEKQKKRLSETRSQLKRTGIDVGNLRQEEKRLTSELVRQERRQDALNRVRKHGGAVSSSLKSAISGVVVAGAAATAAIGSAVGGIVALTSSVAGVGDSIAKTADKVGMGIGPLQEFRYAAERSGVSTSSFDSSLERMTKRISEAAKGSGPASKSIKELGLSAGYLTSIGPEKAMAELADALTNVENPADRVRIAMDLFGREGAGMVNMLKDGSAGLTQLRDDARETGYVLSDDAARNAESYQDAMLNMQLSIGGVKNIVGSALLPVVTGAFKEISLWIKENRAVVSEWSTQFAGRVKDAIPHVVSFARGMASVFSSIGSTVGTLASAVGGFDNLAKVLGAVVAIRAGIKLGSVAKNTWSLARAAKDFIGASGGIKTTASALSGVSQAVPTVGSMAGLIPKLKTGFMGLGGAVKAFIVPLMTSPVTWIIAGIAGAVYLLWKNWDTVVEVASKAFTAIKDFCAPVIQWLDGAWTGTVESIKGAWSGVSGFFSGVWSGIKDTFSFDWISVALKPLFGAAEVIRNAWGGITGFFDGMWGKVKTSFGSAIGWIKGKVDWLKGTVGKVLGMFGIGKDDTSEKKARHKDRGKIAATYAQDTLGVAMEGIDRTGMPYEDPVATAQQTISRAENVSRNTTKTTTVHQQNSVVVHAAPGQDTDALAQEIIRKLEEMQNTGGALYDYGGL